MRIVICVKEVLDPDAVNNYAIAGRLEIGDDGKSLTQTTIPRLINGFDEQALEAGLRIKDAGVDATLVVISIGDDPDKILKHCAALGADELVSIRPIPATSRLPGHREHPGGPDREERRRGSRALRSPGVGRRPGCRARADRREARHAGGDLRARESSSTGSIARR